MLKKQSIFIFFIVAFSFLAFGQKPQLVFLSDTVLVGEPTKAVFYYQHKSNEEIVFPDSNYNYAPFEFISKQYFPTRTENGLSIDSAVYTLSLFEIEGNHKLALPVILYQARDTIKNFSNSDSLTIRPLIQHASDTLKLKSNTSHIPITTDFNYLILLGAVFILILLVILFYIFFGKQIARLIGRYRQKIAHRIFVSNYTSLITNLKSSDKMEEAISLWKKYIERLENKPFTTYTSSEIALNLNNTELKKHLQNIDVAIYGGRSIEGAVTDFSALLNVANNLYHKKMVSRKA